MALTLWTSLDRDINGNVLITEGNLENTSLYYSEDRQQVLNQNGASVAGLFNCQFRGEPVTVFAAKDAAGDVLSLLGLPCPPYYHDSMPEASPGNILT